MLIFTERLILRPWNESDAESLYKVAKDPEVGPIAGWNPHKNVAESRDVIKNILSGEECYAVCLKSDGVAIGAVELMLHGHATRTHNDDECELGYWIGREFWGRGLIPEAAKALLHRAFHDLAMSTVWCGYFDGNTKSKRVQEKLGFVYHHTCEADPVPLMNEVRVSHTNYMTQEMWQDMNM